MPLFEYRCLACQSEFETLVRSGDVPACPSCGSTSLEKQLSMFAVSSQDTQLRSRKRLGTAQRQQAQRTQTEKDFYKSDHHDD